MSHANIPVFIPHRGCPHTCVFCDQRAIAGCAGGEDTAALLAAAERTIEAALSTRPSDGETEIAYFGGSFTGIEPDTMIALLELAQRYVDAGRVRSIRLSTRPDYVGEAVLDILARYSVDTVELGVQSLDDAVLTASRRGHTAACALDAIARLRARGFAVVGQMMLGLPGSSAAAECRTAELLAEAGVAAVRIYPALVLRGTALAAQMAEGGYTPLDLDEAVRRTADLLEIFDAAGVEVLRIGLQETETLPDAVLAGPRHPAFGELALGEVFLRRIDRALAECPCTGAEVTVFVPRGRLSAAVGQKKQNSLAIRQKFSLKTLKVIEKDTLLRYNIQIEHLRKPKREEERDHCI